MSQLKISLHELYPNWNYSIEPRVTISSRKKLDKLFSVNPLATEMTNHNVLHDDLYGERPVTDEHTLTIVAFGKCLENEESSKKYPPEEDIKKLERRVKSEEKKLEGQSGRLPGNGDES